MTVLPIEIINHILSYRQTHHIAKIIEKMNKVRYYELYQTNLNTMNQHFSFSYNFSTWYFDLHLYYKNRKRKHIYNKSRYILLDNTTKFFFYEGLFNCIHYYGEENDLTLNHYSLLFGLIQDHYIRIKKPDMFEIDRIIYKPSKLRKILNYLCSFFIK